MRNSPVRVTLSSIFQAVQGGLGVSVVPSHFYFPVPKLKSFPDKHWTARRPCAGIDFRFPEQIARLESDLLPFSEEWTFSELRNGDDHKFHFNNGFFERVDAEVAYSFVRQRKPKRIIEIGSGNTPSSWPPLCAKTWRKATPANSPASSHFPHPSSRMDSTV